MEREVIYTLNKEFVYKGTKGLEKVKPGILLVSGEKYSFHMHRFFESLCTYNTDRFAPHISFKRLLKLPAKIDALTKIDLRQHPIMLLDLNVSLDRSGNTYNLFNCMGKEVALFTGANFHKPLHFIGHSL